jgi:hypothetical protein
MDIKYGKSDTLASINKHGLVKLYSGVGRQFRTVHFQYIEDAIECMKENNLVPCDPFISRFRYRFAGQSNGINARGYPLKNDAFWRAFPVVNWWVVISLLIASIITRLFPLIVGGFVFAWATEVFDKMYKSIFLGTLATIVSGWMQIQILEVLL